MGNRMDISTLFGKHGSIIRQQSMQILLLANINAPLGTALVSPILHSLMGPFGVSETRLGLMVTVMSTPTIFLIPFIGRLSDQYGRRSPLIAGLLLFGGAGTAIVFTTDFTVVLVLRFLQGVGYAGLTPLIVTSIGDLYVGDREATAQGFRFASSGIIQSSLPVLAGFLIAIAWWYPFLMYAVAFPVALIVYLWFEEPKRCRPRMSDNFQDNGPLSATQDIIRFSIQPHIAAALAARGIIPFLYIGFITYNSFFMVQVLGATTSEAGIMVSLASISYATTATQAGRLTTLFGGKYRPTVVGTVALGGGLAIIGVSPTLAMAALGVVVLGSGFGISLALYRSVITALPPEELRGGFVSISESLGRASIAVSPIVFGFSIKTIASTSNFVVGLRWTFVWVGLFGVMLVLLGTFWTHAYVTS